MTILVQTNRPSFSVIFCFSPFQTVSTEVYLTATIQEDCSRRSEVAAKFPEMVR